MSAGDSDACQRVAHAVRREPRQEREREAGTAATGPTGPVAIPKWTVTPDQPNNGFTVIEYGSPEYPTVSESERIGGKSQFFAAGLQTNSGGCTSLLQTIQLTGRDALIDGGHVKVTFDFYIATFDGQTDGGFGALTFMNSAGHIVSTMQTPTTSKTNGLFSHRIKSQVLPAQTRSIRVTLATQNTHQGAECDVYFDKVRVLLRQS